MREEEIRSFIVRNDILSILLEGQSPLDNMSHIEVLDNSQANRLLTNIGYNIAVQVESFEVFGYFQEAIEFINGVLLKNTKVSVPEAITKISDFKNLLIMASQTRDQSLMVYQLWACACLKVMHVINHIDKDLRNYYFEDAKSYILQRINSILYTEGEKQFLVFPNGVKQPIEKFLIKERKPRKSLILKLLFRKEVAAEEVYDYLGCRIVVKTIADIFPVIKSLIKSGLILPHNLKPGRSRNTLIDLNKYEEKILSLSSDLRANNITALEFKQSLSDYCVKKTYEHENPSSASAYRSVQFTSRHLIRAPNKGFGELKKVQRWAAENNLKLPDINYHSFPKETRFFFPFEIQILDLESYLEVEEGDASHESYRNNQIAFVRERLFGKILNQKTK